MVSRPELLSKCSVFKELPWCTDERASLLGVVDNKQAHPNYFVALSLDEQAFELE